MSTSTPNQYVTCRTRGGGTVRILKGPPEHTAGYEVEALDFKPWTNTDIRTYVTFPDGRWIGRWISQENHPHDLMLDTLNTIKSIPAIIHNGSNETLNISTTPNVEVMATGAKRGTDVNGLRYDLLSPVVMMSMAGVFAEGASKYGDNNYQKGFQFSNLLSHAMQHLMMFMLGDKSENHLTHAAWNINAMIHFSVLKPEMNDLYNYQLTPGQIQKMKELFTFNPKKETTAGDQ